MTITGENTGRFYGISYRE